MYHSSPAADTNAVKKPQPLPWTHQETLNLIQAYQEKWYSLQCGQLKASQWEEVATRCGLFAAKTVLQCRHKMEKLRRRYRSVNQGLGSGSPWPYYDAMEALEHGPLLISGRPLTSIVSTREKHFYPGDGQEAGNNYHNDDEEGEEEQDDNDEEEDYRFHKSRSFNHILRRPSVVNRFSGLLTVGKKRVRPEEGRDGDGDMGMEEKDRRVGLAVEIRRFAERFERMERKKMEIMHETERFRMEMERKRIEVILDSQKKIVDAILASFGSNKRVKVEEGLGSSRNLRG